MNTNTVTRIPELDDQLAARSYVDPAPLVDGYANAVDKDLDIIVLNDWSLFPSQVEAIVRAMKDHDIDEVALVDRSTALRDILWAFRAEGCTLEMILVDCGISPWADEREYSPGFLITL